MLSDNFTVERLVITNTDMTEAGFTAILAVLREGNNTVRELSIGSQLLRSREVSKNRMKQRKGCPGAELLPTTAVPPHGYRHNNHHRRHQNRWYTQHSSERT